MNSSSRKREKSLKTQVVKKQDLKSHLGNDPERAAVAYHAGWCVVSVSKISYKQKENNSNYRSIISVLGKNELHCDRPAKMSFIPEQYHDDCQDSVAVDVGNATDVTNESVNDWPSTLLSQSEAAS